MANFGHGGNRKDQAANLPLETSQTETANLLNVSKRSVASAKKVETQAIPEVVQAVEAGKLPVSVDGVAFHDPP